MTTRPAVLPDRFYPADPQTLANTVDALLSEAQPPDQPDIPKLLIIPHAGYVYSGKIAALAYSCVRSRISEIQRVVLLSPTHRVGIPGIALPESDFFSTPLGDIPIDVEAGNRLRDLAYVTKSDRVHAEEHAIEVHLPLLQRLLSKGFNLVPLAVGSASPDMVAEVLNRLWGDQETLIVISSDLSHFHPYDEAEKKDQGTSQKILSLDNTVQPDEACGSFAINGALLVARQRGLSPSLIKRCNSGDTAGNPDRVVGYGSFAFYPAKEIPPLGRALLTLARNAISAHFGGASLPLHYDMPELHDQGGSFVTLTLRGQLRGCIGSLQAHRPLGLDIQENALSAALRDARFLPVSATEWPLIKVEVSLLEPPEPLSFDSQEAAFAQLRPHIDGVIFSAGNHRSTFLPQVWDQLPDVQSFMANLRHKAGLPADYWGPDVRIERYTVQKWKEPGV